MKNIKFLIMLALAAAVMTGFNACTAKTSASSSGVSASTTTTGK